MKHRKTALNRSSLHSVDPRQFDQDLQDAARIRLKSIAQFKTVTAGCSGNKQ